VDCEECIANGRCGWAECDIPEDAQQQNITAFMLCMPLDVFNSQNPQLTSECRLTNNCTAILPVDDRVTAGAVVGGAAIGIGGTSLAGAGTVILAIIFVKRQRQVPGGAANVLGDPSQGIANVSDAHVEASGPQQTNLLFEPGA